MDDPFRFDHPKISIAIPVFNGARYLAIAVQSALDQTYDNIEIVIVDDGSTDGGETAAIARRFDGPKVKFIQQQNQGVGGALNTAVANMSGDFFCWLSHDDIHLPHKTAAQVAYYKKLGRQNAILCSDYYVIDADGNPVTEIKLSSERLRRTPQLALLDGLINGCTLFIPIDVLRAVGPFDPNLKFTQDYDLWNKILYRYDFFHQPETLIKYRVHDQQDSKISTKQTLRELECDNLWIRILESRSTNDRALLSGSTKLFFDEMANFLDRAAYKGAAAYSRQRARQAIPETLVSVVLPFFNEVDLVIRAAKSALGQTHERVELLLVDDGSTTSIEPIVELCRHDARARLIHQTNRGPGAARNRGMQAASGEYVAFLDADDRFVPQKIQRQLATMQARGSIFSHTSYHVLFPEHEPGVGRLASGLFTGPVYPRIIAGCPIATPTVMLHRLVIDAGYQFPALFIGEDTLLWIDLAERYELLGIDEPLSIVEWSETTAAVNHAKSLEGLENYLRTLRAHPVHSTHRAEIDAIAELYRRKRASLDGVENAVQVLDKELIAAAFA